MLMPYICNPYPSAKETLQLVGKPEIQSAILLYPRLRGDVLAHPKLTPLDFCCREVAHG